jgi:small GTP-binding protein
MVTVHQKKICLLGDFAVGKTSLIRRFVEGRFDEKYLSTIGVTVSRKVVVRGEAQLQMLIWDLAGGEQFSGYRSNYLRGAAGALIVMDLTRPETLPSLADYAWQLRAVSSEANIVFLGNKVDLELESSVSVRQIAEAVEEFNSPLLTTSAKTGRDVDAAFQTLGALMELPE